MRGGLMRSSIAIQSDTGVARDELNQRIPGWTTVRTIFCDKAVVSGKEFFDATTKERFAQTLYRFRCRWVDADGIDPLKMRICHENKLYDIRAVLPDEAKHVDCVIEATLQTPKA